MSTSSDVEIPTTAIPLLPLIRGVIFPETVTAIPVGRDRSVALVHDLAPGDLVAVGVQLEPQTEHPDLEDLYPVATLSRVQQVVRMAGGGFRVILRGLRRVSLEAMPEREPFWRAEVSAIEEVGHDDERAQELFAMLREHVAELSEKNGGALTEILSQHSHPGSLADRVAAELGMETERRARILCELDVTERLERVLEALGEIVTRSEVKATIDKQVREKLGKNQREAILREQLKAIKEELGQSEEDGPVDELKNKLEEALLPEEVRRIAERELGRMEAMNPSPGRVRRHPQLPGMDRRPALARQRRVDHQDQRARRAPGRRPPRLHDVKKRILEHMAVLKVSGNIQGTILCLAGPPGVGKTSLAQSVAEAIGRPLVRISLGGVRDEAEIRGHRRTYVGALPGRLINAMRKAGANNPVMVLDEVDKLGNSWMGSPEAALLEVLDPEQNANFTDHYLELPFDCRRSSSSARPTRSRSCQPRCATASRSSRSRATPPTRR